MGEMDRELESSVRARRLHREFVARLAGMLRTRKIWGRVQEKKAALKSRLGEYLINNIERPVSLVLGTRM